MSKEKQIAEPSKLSRVSEEGERSLYTLGPGDAMRSCNTAKDEEHKWN